MLDVCHFGKWAGGSRVKEWYFFTNLGTPENWSTCPDNGRGGIQKVGAEETQLLLNQPKFSFKTTLAQIDLTWDRAAVQCIVCTRSQRKTWQTWKVRHSVWSLKVVAGDTLALSSRQQMEQWDWPRQTLSSWRPRQWNRFPEEKIQGRSTTTRLAPESTSFVHKP